MSEFTRELRGYRLADTLRGDTLQAIAMRELGDASRWVDLASINRLRPPYLTDDAAQASDRVLLTGSVIVVPATSSAAPDAESTSPDHLYKLDLGLVSGDLQATDSGDLLVFNGQANLRQALVHRVITERRELLFHPEYGCLVRTVIGSVNGPTAGVLAAQYVRATLRADPRVKEVIGVTADVRGDTINVVANVLPITGQSTKIEVRL